MRAGKVLYTVSMIIALFHLGLASAAGKSITTTISAKILSIESGPIDSSGYLVDTNYKEIDYIDLFNVQYDDESAVATKYSGNLSIEIHKDFFPFKIDFLSDAIFSFSQPIQEILSKYPNQLPQDSYYSVVHGTGLNFQFDIVGDNIGQFEGKWDGTGANTLRDASLRTWYSDGTPKMTLLFGDPSWVRSSPTAVPEPTTMLLFGAGLLGLAVFGRKGKK